ESLERGAFVFEVILAQGDDALGAAVDRPEHSRRWLAAACVIGSKFHARRCASAGASKQSAGPLYDERARIMIGMTALVRVSDDGIHFRQIPEDRFGQGAEVKDGLLIDRAKAAASSVADARGRERVVELAGARLGVLLSRREARAAGILQVSRR